MHNEQSGESLFDHNRLRAPALHGESLQHPALSEAGDLWATNVEGRKSELAMNQVRIGDSTLNSVQTLGRQEVVALANQYTSAYLDVDLAGRSAERIVMAGHQPELFHPGVWFKNFSLSKLGKQFNATPINLIVDNDTCGNGAIRFPHAVGEQVRWGTIPIVQRGPNIPFEARTIVDWDFFTSFPERARTAIAPLSTQRILADRVWQNILEAKEVLGQSPLLGQTLVMGRHRLESEIGLKTLELPLSQVAQTEAFAIFAQAILFEIERFQVAYNQSLSDYRQQNNIRSDGHPVPKLEVKEGWYECPFWFWQTENANRKRLFAKPGVDSIQLSDGGDWQLSLDSDSFVEEFQSLTNQGVAIRPRALITTMYSRLILSDLFLHGIGGAIYDRLTNVISTRFFGVRPPGFMALSATMKLRCYFDEPVEVVTRTELTRANQMLRELKFHPERHLAQEDVQPKLTELLEQKIKWIGDQSRSKARHQAIEAINEKLQAFVTPSRNEMVEQRNQIASRIKTSETLDSREFSFCLFPDSVIDELKGL